VEEEERMNHSLSEDNSKLQGKPLIQVFPVIDHTVRALCAKPYPLHPKGCPNVGKCDRCPPRAPLFEEVFDIAAPVYAVINEFDLGMHVIKMRASNPGWSYRQLSCVLYWQGTARKQLKQAVETILPAFTGYAVTYCPEGMGVDVTATLAATGIELEWPPVKVARQVAFLAKTRQA
jgi:hypothetical protein